MHLSEVIHEMGKVIMETQEREIDNDTRMQFEKGYLWEVTLSMAFGEKAAMRIGEVELDGIIGSPDGICYDDPLCIIPIVEEYKCTAKNSKTQPTDMWKWMAQAKGYCKMVGATKCIFRVLHLSFVPVYKVWELVFTQGELDENWQSVVSMAKTMKKGE